MHQAASLFHEGFGWISNGTEPNRKHCVGKCLLHVQNRWWTEFPEQSWLSDDVPVASDDHQHTQKKEHKITWLITQDSNETNTATIWSSVFILWSSYFPLANKHLLKRKYCLQLFTFYIQRKWFPPSRSWMFWEAPSTEYVFFSITFFFVVIFGRNSNPPALKFYHSFFNGLERNNLVFICCKGSISNGAMKSRCRPGRHSSKMDQ